MSATTGIDYNVLLNTILGGIITISGSLAVAALYIRNQNKNQRIRRTHELVQQSYFEEGLYPILSALSEYGTTTVFALADTRKWLGRCLQKREINDAEFTRELAKIRQRPVVVDLTAHNFASILKYLPTLQKFGNPVFGAVLRTLQLYSSLVEDGTSSVMLMRTCKESSVDEVVRSLGAIAQIIDLTVIYLEKRFTDLKDFFMQQKLEDYNDFSKVLLEEKYEKFTSTIEQYKNGLTQLMDAMTSENSEERPKATLSFSKWLNENMERNPLKEPLENVEPT